MSAAIEFEFDDETDAEKYARQLEALNDAYRQGDAVKVRAVRGEQPPGFPILKARCRCGAKFGLADNDPQSSKRHLCRSCFRILELHVEG